MIRNSLPACLFKLSVRCECATCVHSSVAHAHALTEQSWTLRKALFCANSCHGLFFTQNNRVRLPCFPVCTAAPRSPMGMTAKKTLANSRGAH